MVIGKKFWDIARKMPEKIITRHEVENDTIKKNIKPTDEKV